MSLSIVAVIPIPANGGAASGLSSTTPLYFDASAYKGVYSISNINPKAGTRYYCGSGWILKEREQVRSGVSNLTEWVTVYQDYFSHSISNTAGSKYFRIRDYLSGTDLDDRDNYTAISQRYDEREPDADKISGLSGKTLHGCANSSLPLFNCSEIFTIYNVDVKVSDGGEFVDLPNDDVLFTYKDKKYFNAGQSIAKWSVKPKSGYRFVGWKDQLGNIVEVTTTLTVRGDALFEDVDITASFEAIPTYTLTYNSNNGFAENFLQQGTDEEQIEIQKNTFEKGRHVFVEWNTEADGSGKKYVNGEKITLTEDLSLYAIWRRNYIEITNTNPLAGKLLLFSISENKTVAEQESDGVISYDGINGYTYRVDVKELNSFYNVLGVLESGEYLNPYQFKHNSELITRDFYFKEKNFYSVSFEFLSEGDTASVTSPAAPDKDGKYVEGRAITVTGNPAPGNKLKAATIFNADTGLPIGDFDNIENNAFAIEKITCNLRIACVFVKVDYVVGVNIDEKSKDAISDVTAMMGNTHVVTATYGDTVTFEADVANGYLFGGWYADNILLSKENPYDHTVTGNVTLTAKAAVEVNLDIAYEDNRVDKTTSIDNTCSLSVDGESVVVPYRFEVILGKSFSYALSLGALVAGEVETWKFDAWYSGNTKLQYRKDDTITPNAAITMTAKVTSAPILRTLSVRFLNEETNDEIAISEDAVKILPEPIDKKVDGSTVSFTINGTQEMRLTFADEVETGERLAFSKVVIGGKEFFDPVFDYLVNDNISATAYYGSTGERTTSIDFADESDRTMGEIVLEGMTSNEEPTPIAITKNRGESVGIMAMSKNGYRFVGWYLNAIGIGDPYIKDGSIQLKVTTNRTLFAKFVQDPNAVYEWEGASENKMMVWRSKTYEASKPFNPSACRVDTTGYPVALLSVEMFSAPDKEPTAVAKLTNVQSQNARRLPIRRMERYMQVAVRNDEEVDIILVGTSMGGLAI